MARIDDFQVYVCNPATLATSGCSWNNVQSTQGGAPQQQQPPPGANTPPTPAVATPQPDGIRITLRVPEGDISRERELPRFGGAQS